VPYPAGRLPLRIFEQRYLDMLSRRVTVRHPEHKQALLELDDPLQCVAAPRRRLNPFPDGQSRRRAAWCAR
jgi:hypothetical protein